MMGRRGMEGVTVRGSAADLAPNLARWCQQRQDSRHPLRLGGPRHPPGTLPEDGFNAAELPRYTLEPVLPQVDHVDVVRHSESASNVLVDEDDADALTAEGPQGRVNPLRDHWRHACRRLVDE